MDVLQELIGLIDVLGRLGDRPTVDPTDRAFLWRHERYRLTGFLEVDCWSVPGLPDDATVRGEARLGVVRRIPELLDPRFACNRLLEQHVVDLLHRRFVLESVKHAVGGKLAVAVHPQSDAQKQRVRTPLHLTLVFLVPQRPVAELLGVDLGQVIAPGNGFGAPAMRHVIELAIPNPIRLRGIERRRQDAVDREPLLVEGREHFDVLELRRAIMRRLAHIEALALCCLQLVDLLFVLRERRHIDLDAGFLFEGRDHRGGLLVIPVQ